MLRFILLFVVGVAIVAMFSRRRAAKRTLWALLAILGIYAVLKATGAIEAIAPARDGVF